MKMKYSVIFSVVFTWLLSLHFIPMLRKWLLFFFGAICVFAEVLIFWNVKS